MHAERVGREHHVLGQRQASATEDPRGSATQQGQLHQQDQVEVALQQLGGSLRQAVVRCRNSGSADRSWQRGPRFPWQARQRATTAGSGIAGTEVTLPIRSETSRAASSKELARRSTASPNADWSTSCNTLGNSKASM